MRRSFSLPAACAVRVRKAGTIGESDKSADCCNNCLRFNMVSPQLCLGPSQQDQSSGFQRRQIRIVRLIAACSTPATTSAGKPPNSNSPNHSMPRFKSDAPECRWTNSCSAGFDRSSVNCPATSAAAKFARDTMAPEFSQARPSFQPPTLGG